jgi:hypothetical protein
VKCREARIGAAPATHNGKSSACVHPVAVDPPLGEDGFFPSVQGRRSRSRSDAEGALDGGEGSVLALPGPMVTDVTRTSVHPGARALPPEAWDLVGTVLAGSEATGVRGSCGAEARRRWAIMHLNLRVPWLSKSGGRLRCYRSGLTRAWKRGLSG